VQQPSTKRALFSRRAKFLWAATALLLINFAFLLADPIKNSDPINLPSAHTWEWWRTRSYLSEKRAPDVVLLGSSLVMIPVSVFDADFLNKEIDAAKHYEANYLEDRLVSIFKIPTPLCINFGLPGGMVSDDYMVARALFRGNQKPKVIVIGLTLRDFIEGHVMYPAMTTTFKYYQHFFDTSDLVAISMPQWWQRFEYYFGKTFAISGQRLELQLATSDALRNALRPIMSVNSKPTPVDSLKLNHNLATKLRPVVEEGEYILHPNCPLPFDDNSKEYKTRFKSPNEAVFQNECKFLDRLLTYAESNNIKVLIANMPLTPANMALMPPGSYGKYMGAVDAAVKKHGCAYIELNDQNQFLQSDFMDTAHMNAGGGRKYIDAVVAAIEADEKLSAPFIATRQTVQLASQHRSVY